MRGKFLGFCLIAASTALLSMSSMEQESDAGLFRRLFGGGAYASCGGGGGLQSYSSCGGGGGLQMYSSCGGGGGGLQSYSYSAYSSCGGGGGGLQYAPVTYYTPAASGCPGGVCPPQSDGFSYYHSAPVIQYARTIRYAAPAQVRYVNPVPTGIHLNPGERYVAGSLRPAAVQSTAIARRDTLAPAASVAETRSRTLSAESKPVQRDTWSENPTFPEGTVLYQITQKGCEPCAEDQRLAESVNVPLELLYLDDAEDAVKIANLWQKADCELTGTPAYVLAIDGKTEKIRVKPIDDASVFVEMAKTSRRLGMLHVASLEKTKQEVAVEEPPAEDPEPPQVVMLHDTTEERLTKLEEEFSSIRSDVAAMRQLLETKVAKSK